MMMTSQHDGLCVDKALAVVAAVAISNQENSATQKRVSFKNDLFEGAFGR